MEAYKPYIDFILAGKVAETAYILSHQGAICATNLPIKEMPRYEFELEDEKDPNIKHKIVVDERLNLLDALEHEGVCKNKAGIRLYNQKYYTARFSGEPSPTLYLKKEKGGACIVKTGKLIIVGTFNSSIIMDNKAAQNPGELNKRVETLAANLVKQGY